MKKNLILIFIAVLLLVCGNFNLSADKGGGRIYPIYDISQDCLMGAWTDDGWINADSAATFVGGGESYEFYSMMRPHITAQGGKTSNDEMSPCPEVRMIEFNGCANVAEHLVAFSGEWDALPRIPKAIKPNARIKKILANYLVENGIKKPKLKIDKVFAIDLDGKGILDTVIQATYYKDEFYMAPKAGYYSVIIVQKQVNGVSATIPLATDIHTKEEESLMFENSILGFFDFNNDGKLEILMQERYYEGSYSVLMGIENDSPVHYLDCGCGV